jgi:starch synthase
MQRTTSAEKKGSCYTSQKHSHTLPLDNTLSPSYDNVIARKYSARTIEHKMENKTALQESLGWIEEQKQPILCIPTGLSDEADVALFEQMIAGLLELPLGIVILGRGSKKCGEMVGKLVGSSGHRIAVVADDDKHLRKLLAGSDMALFLSGNHEDAVVAALSYGCVPIAQESHLTENYSPTQESGNAFTYSEATVWQCFASVVRALETFKFPYDWRTIQRHAIESITRREELIETK